MAKTKSKKEVKDIDENLEAILANINKGVKDSGGKIWKLREHQDNVSKTPAVPYNIPSVDEASSIGGVPMGKIIELYGHESSGKSYLAYKAMSSAQECYPDRKVLLLDAEHSFVDDWVKFHGVNTDDMLYSDDFLYGEEYLDACKLAIQKDLVSVVVIDSTAALTPKSIMDASLSDNKVADHARMISRGLQQIQHEAAVHGTTVIFINQIREKVGVMFGCFQGETLVSFADGRRVPIQTVVENKMTGPVLSYNKKTNSIEESNIVNWFHNGDIDPSSEEFLQFICSGPGTKNGRLGFCCTPNHTIYMEDGTEMPANEVVVGDRLMSYRESLVLRDPVHKQVLYGSLLGDGHISLTSENCAHLCLQNSEQKEYLEWKMAMLPMLSFKDRQVGNGFIRYEARSSLEMKCLNDEFYENGCGYRKIPECLNEITPLMAAIWYMDDGCYVKEGDSDKITISIKRLGTKERQVEKAIALIESLSKDLQYCVGYTKSGKNLIINRDGVDPFMNVVSPYIHHSMMYKVPEQFHSLVGSSLNTVCPNILEPELVPYVAQVLEKRPAGKNKYKKLGKYDIQIENNSTYLVGGGSGVVVHNSPETTPGGRALKFYSHQRIKTYRKKTLYENPEDKANGKPPIGILCGIEFVKNKVGVPFRKGEFIIYFTPEANNPVVKLAKLSYNAKIIKKIKKNFQWGKGKDAIKFDGTDFVDLTDALIERGLVLDLLKELGKTITENELDLIIPPDVEELEFDESKIVSPRNQKTYYEQQGIHYEDRSEVDEDEVEDSGGGSGKDADDLAEE